MTKSGTDQFHGGLFEIFRNDKMDARNFFSVNKTQLRYNDFGGSIGGPIKKDKLFFFFGQEIKRLRQTQNPTRVTVPDTNYPERHLQRVAPINDPGTTTPYPNNVLPASLITPDGKAIANVYKLMSQQASFFNDADVSNNVILQPDQSAQFPREPGPHRLSHHVDTHTLVRPLDRRRQQPGGSVRHLLQLRPSHHADPAQSSRRRAT